MSPSRRAARPTRTWYGSASGPRTHWAGRRTWAGPTPRTWATTARWLRADVRAMSDPTRPADAAPPIPTGLTPDRVPEFAPRASGRQAGLRIPSLGADGAHGGTAPPEAGAAAAGTAGTAAAASATRRERPLRSAVVCGMIAVVGAVVFAMAAS